MGTEMMNIKLLMTIKLDELRSEWKNGRIDEGHEDKGREMQLIECIEMVDYVFQEKHNG